MSNTENLGELSKTFSNLCEISENENTFQGIVQWNIPNRDIKKHLEYVKKPIQSNKFSIGSPSFCSFYFNLLPDIFHDKSDSKEYLKSLSVSIVFNSKLPDSAWIKGKIHFQELDAYETFSTGAECFQKKIEIQMPCNHSDFEKFNSIYEKGLDLIMYCSTKITVKEVKCAFDKNMIKYAESKNYDCNREKFKHDFSDVSIHIGDHLFMTHKTLLAQIPYFQELFDANESQKRFELTDINHEIFNYVLTYLYSGDIPILSFKLACELYIVAGDLKISNLKSLCSSYLGANLTDVNVVIVLKLSHENEDPALKEECFKFIKKSNPETLTEKSIIL